MKTKKIVVVKIILISIIFCLSLFLKKDNSFSTLNIEINGNGHSEYIDSLDILNDCPLLLTYYESSENIDINTKLLEDSISNIDYVYNAEVYLRGNDLNILIEQNNPFLRLGQNYYLNQEGDTISAIRKNVFGDYMNVSDVLFFSGNIIDKNQICEIADYIYKDFFMNSLIKGVHYDKDLGYIFYPRLFDIKIIFGDTVQMQNKFNKIKTFYKQISKSPKIIDRLGNLKIISINVQYEDQIICQKNN